MAELVDAPVLGTGPQGLGFESLQVHQIKKPLQMLIIQCLQRFFLFLLFLIVLQIRYYGIVLTVYHYCMQVYSSSALMAAEMAAEAAR